MLTLAAFLSLNIGNLDVGCVDNLKLLENNFFPFLCRMISFDAVGFLICVPFDVFIVG